MPVKVAVIGGGVAGLATGWRMAQRGTEVVVIERGEPGQGATRAAAGMIAVAGETAEAPQAEAEFARHASRLWPSFAAEVEAVSGLDVSYLRNGALFLPPDHRAVKGDEGVFVVSSERARLLEPMLTGAHARFLWAPDEAQVDNRALGPALARALVESGGRIVPEEARSLVVQNGRAMGVQTSSGVVAADVVLVAAGAWSARIEGIPAELKRVRPIKGEMIALSGAGEKMSRVVRSADAYLVPRGSSVFVGATVEDVGFDTTLTQSAADRLHRAAVELLPALAEWNVVEHWTGFRPGTPDGLPLVGATSVEGVFAATGQYRNGILFAPALAELACRAVLDGAPVPIEFNPRRFAPGAGACA
jgi:glycine oxidase